MKRLPCHIFPRACFRAAYPATHALGLLLVTFALSAFSPVDRVLQIVGDHASQSTHDQVRHQLGLDRRCRCSSGHYLVNLARRPRRRPAPLASRCCTTCSPLSATLELATPGAGSSGALFVIAGVLCACYAGSPWDLAVRTLTLIGNSVPISGSGC